MIKEKFLFSVTGNLFERSSLVFLAALYVRWPRTLERACTSACWGWGEADCLASFGIMAAHCGSWASALTQHGEVFLKIPSVLTGTDPPFVSCSPPEPSVRHHLQLGRRVGDQHRPRQVCELDVHAQWEHARPALLRILGFLLAVSFGVYSFPPLPPHCLIWNWIIDCSEDRMTPVDLISNPRISVSAFLWSKACLLKVKT